MDTFANAEAIEAMLIRAEHAHKLLRRGELDGIEALRVTIMPTRETRAASLAVARESGPSELALWLAAGGRAPKERKKRGAPGKGAPLLGNRSTESLDDCLSRLR